MTSKQHKDTSPPMEADTAPATIDQVDQEADDQRQVAYRASQFLLTPAAAAFAEFYAVCHNQIKAYQHAYPGSSVNAARANARHLFADHRVQSEIRRVTERYVDHTRATLMQAEQVLSRLAHADIRRLFDAAGNLLSPHQWDLDTAAAVASYKETPTKDGIFRTVRLHDKHAAARTLMEAKGAFEKNKAPPGVAAIFNINLGGRTMQLGAPIDQGRTITDNVAEPGKLTKPRQLPKAGKTKAATSRIAKAKALFKSEP